MKSRIVVFNVSLALAAWGQSEAGISGTVTDSTGAAIPSASLVIRNVETGASRALTADGAGRYSVPSLPIGGYEITAEASGFSPLVKTGISLVVGQQAEVNLALQVGELKQAVTVVENATPVNLSTEQISGLVGERQVKDLPLNGRSYDGLITLNPGTVNYSAERSGGIGTSNSAVGNMFAVSGRRPQENLFLLNGIEYTGASEINVTPGGASGQLLGVEAVREFSVVSDVYGAQYGKRPGAQISIVTASGANDVHGTAYEFLRNSALDARNFFDVGNIPQFQRNEFGGALGGPIKKDKTFLFGNYEGFRQHLGLSDVTLVPDNNARNGLIQNANGTFTNVGITPGAKQLLALWPVQNGPSLGSGIGLAYSHPLQIIREDFGTARLDHAISNSDSLSGVYTIDDSTDNTPTGNPLSSIYESLREQVASLQETHIFSPTMLNTARIGFSRGGYYFTGSTPVNIPGWVQGAPIGAVVVGGGTASNAASQITAAGTNVGSNLTSARNLFTYEDHINLTRGIHRIEAGVWIQRIQNNDNMAQNQYGQASFSSLTSFLQGTIATFTVVPQSTLLGWRSLEAAEYVQDNIKVRPNLEISLGFRLEHSNGMSEVNGRASNYWFDQNGVIETQPHVGNNVFSTNNARFLPEPRIGIAWDPFGKQKTVIHTGFGVYHEQLDSLSYRLDQNGPYNPTVALKNVPLAGLLIVPGAALPSGSKATPSGIQPDAKIPTVLSYNFNIEQQLARNLSVTVGYTGSHGYHQIISIDANLPFPTICPTSPCPASLAAGTIYFPSGAPLGNPAVGNTTTWWSSGLSFYNALHVDVNHRLRNGLQIRAVYTYSKSLDDGTAWNSSVGANAPGFVMYPLNPRIDWGLSTYDVRNAAVINGTYELPIGRGKFFGRSASGTLDKLIGGWSVGGIGTFQSGFPFTPQLGFNPANDGDSRNPVRPSWNPAFSGPVILGSPNQYFNPNAFILPAAGTYGNVGRDTLIGPGIASVDFSALKNTQLSERLRLQFRAEFFNILNHANFTTPNTVVFTSATSGVSPTAGVITATSTTSRQIQFGMKLIW
ncbi:MAG TPA: carboxypeptidase-like regulatory domain-containing protein [Bryobacteraceae bacterium]|nr:carboxypeptidase-like regulatory domain-containing protein [Bryobacteraceae bacterium]